MNWKSRSAILVLICALLLPVGCKKDFRGGLMSRVADKGYTREQQLEAYYMSFRTIFGKQVEGKFVVNYEVLALSDVEKQLKYLLSQYDSILDFKEVEINKLLTAYGLRPQFTHNERVTQAMYARVVAAIIYNQYLERIGMRPYSSEYQFGGGYNPRIFIMSNIDQEISFKLGSVEKARDAGLLKPIETLHMSHNITYSRKYPDPNDPNDPNKFVWREEKMGLEATKYKIMDNDKPTNNNGNYFEAYRVIDGKKESKPAMRAFITGSSGETFILVDDDFEGRDIGFGLPDSVVEMDEAYLFKEDLYRLIFAVKEEEKRIEPKPEPIRVEIVRIGDDVSPWEKAKDAEGWLPPESYKAQPLQDNYNIKIMLKHSTEFIKKPNPTVEIDAFLKEWTRAGSRYDAGVGAVVEYYRPKAPYNSALVSAKVAYNDDTKMVSLILTDGREVKGQVTPGPNIFIEDKPYAIDYTLGDKSYRIQDKDGDGKYEERKEIKRSNLNTGNYY